MEIQLQEDTNNLHQQPDSYTKTRIFHQHRINRLLVNVESEQEALDKLKIHSNILPIEVMDFNTRLEYTSLLTRASKAGMDVCFKSMLLLGLTVLVWDGMCTDDISSVKLLN